jgi:WD40 repeat protein
VECVATCPSSPDLIATGSWDRTIRLWGRGVAAPAPHNKSRTAKSAPPPLEQRACLDRIHNQTVADLCWPEPAIIYSVSWDRTLRRIDPNNNGGVVQTWTLSDAASSVAHSPASGLIAVGHADRTVRLLDPRLAQAGTTKSLSGHQAWVSDVAWSLRTSTMMASVSYDCTLKIWDVRSTTAALHTLQADTGGASGAKTFAVDWGSDGVIACGGTDGHLRLHRTM